MQRRAFLGVMGAGAVTATSGCLAGLTGDGEPGAIADATLTLTTTTSTYDTGLLEEVNEAFTERFGAEVDAVGQGTGQALQTARDGDSDIVMVHARSLEDEFMQEGYGVNRRDLMFNDFVIIGDADDPAGIEGMDEATEAFTTIADEEVIFVSRGDNSGTHTKELGIWEAAGIEPEGDWYRETGSGMGEVINQTNLEEGAYTLADRGTYLSMQSEIDLEILVQGPIEDGPEMLSNAYGIIAVNPEVHDHVEYDLAMAYIGFLTSQEGQEVIENYTSEGEQLFYPQALSEEPNFEQYVPADWRQNEE